MEVAQPFPRHAVRLAECRRFHHRHTFSTSVYADVGILGDQPPCSPFALHSLSSFSPSITTSCCSSYVVQGGLRMSSRRRAPTRQSATSLAFASRTPSLVVAEAAAKAAKATKATEATKAKDREGEGPRTRRR